ncbi:MAG TPA: hypothetical protein DEB24_08210 [Coriobacteriia bacterium]|nr:hypothetical protein [Coriobacteriia bacterium]
MPGSCWVCNPFCGKCQPAPVKSGRCPDCGGCTVFKREDILADGALLCKTCGADLSELVRPQAIRCNYSGNVCVYPCGKGRGEVPKLGHQICRRNTAPA